MFTEKVKNGNGEVNFSDYACALSTLSRGTIDDKIKWIFKLYDTNEDGILTIDEIICISRAIYGLLGIYVKPAHDLQTVEEHGNQIFKRFDRNSQGYITFEQFMEICLKVIIK
jgi:Kv channel-interacting protein 2